MINDSRTPFHLITDRIWNIFYGCKQIIFHTVTDMWQEFTAHFNHYTHINKAHFKKKN